MHIMKPKLSLIFISLLTFCCFQYSLELNGHPCSCNEKGPFYIKYNCDASKGNFVDAKHSLFISNCGINKYTVLQQEHYF